MNDATVTNDTTDDAQPTCLAREHAALEAQHDDEHAARLAAERAEFELSGLEA